MCDGGEEAPAEGLTQGPTQVPSRLSRGGGESRKQRKEASGQPVERRGTRGPLGRSWSAGVHTKRWASREECRVVWGGTEGPRGQHSQLAENVTRSRGTGAREATRKGQKWAPSAMPFH